MKYPNWSHLVAVGLLSGLGPSVPVGAAAAQPIKPPKSILFVGNSFTMGSGCKEIAVEGGVNGMVRKFAVAAGQPSVEVKRAAKVGQSLGQQLEDVAQAVTLVNQREWDVVVLQELSLAATEIPDPRNPDKHLEDFFDSGKAFAALIRKRSPNARIILFEPWARQAAYWFYGKGGKYPRTPEDMQKEITANHNKLAEQIGAELAPVGQAFMASLSQRPEMGLYGPDKYHANGTGGYLAALVVYATIYGNDPKGLPAFAGVPEAETPALQSIARETARVAIPVDKQRGGR